MNRGANERGRVPAPTGIEGPHTSEEAGGSSSLDALLNERATYTREHSSGHFWRPTKAGDPRTPASHFLEFLQGRSVSQLAVRLADMTGDAPRKWSRKLYRILNCEKHGGTRTVSLADADAICLVLGVPLSEVWVEE